MNNTIEQFNEQQFKIELKKTGKLKGTCTAKSESGAIVKFKYFYNKKLSGLEMQIDRCGLLNSGKNGSNIILVDDNNKSIDEYDSKSVMNAKFCTPLIWKFIKNTLTNKGNCYEQL